MAPIAPDIKLQLLLLLFVPYYINFYFYQQLPISKTLSPTKIQISIPKRNYVIDK